MSRKSKSRKKVAVKKNLAPKLVNIENKNNPQNEASYQELMNEVNVLQNSVEEKNREIQNLRVSMGNLRTLLDSIRARRSYKLINKILTTLGKGIK